MPSDSGLTPGRRETTLGFVNRAILLAPLLHALACGTQGSAVSEQRQQDPAPALEAIPPAPVVTARELLPLPPLPRNCASEDVAALTELAGSTHQVLLISVDGLAPRYLEDLLAKGQAPTFQRLIDQGASTFNARTEARITVTIPNHTSMISGRPAVEVPGLPLETHHGVVYNDDPVDTAILHGENTSLPYLTSIFDEVHDRGGYTGLFTGKDKFAVFERSYAAPHARKDTIGEDDGDKKIDDFSVVFDASLLVPQMLTAIDAGIAAKPETASFTMFHFRDTDALGHASGWDSPEYVGALERVDGLIGNILDHIASSTVFPNMIVLVTTDHAGLGLTHDDIADERIFRIPFFVWGKGVPAGVDLYEASLGTRVDPGTAAPVDGTDSQPIRNGDAANLALWLLGLEPIEGSLHRGMQLGMPVCPEAVETVE